MFFHFSSKGRCWICAGRRAEGSGRAAGCARTLRQKFWLDVTLRHDLHADVAQSVA